MLECGIHNVPLHLKRIRSNENNDRLPLIVYNLIGPCHGLTTRRRRNPRLSRTACCHACHFVQALRFVDESGPKLATRLLRLIGHKSLVIILHNKSQGRATTGYYLLRINCCRSRLDSYSFDRIITSMLLFGHSMCPFMPRIMCVLLALSGDCCFGF